MEGALVKRATHGTRFALMIDTTLEDQRRLGHDIGDEVLRGSRCDWRPTSGPSIALPPWRGGVHGDHARRPVGDAQRVAERIRCM
jgi:hypothetical protein